jgi:two-component system chemotaxis response regulator CheB
MRGREAVVIGGSSGGFDALRRLLELLPAGLPLAILAVLHREPTSDALLARLLACRCRLPVKEVDEKESIRPGVVYVAPANYHLLVERDLSLSLSVDPRVCYSRPSIDVLFESAADAYRERLVGVLLTGANQDGTHGLRWIKARGGLTVAQDPRQAHAAVMPRSAIEAGVVDRVLALEEIAALLAVLGPDHGLPNQTGPVFETGPV